jgi:L-ascorbate metabolism protein UlaG (beta-lactamase superfamily)
MEVIMEITYLGHSGFLVETSDAYFLFDYIRGELPAFSKEKRLYVFASHAHHDHWDSAIFTDQRLKGAACFIIFPQKTLASVGGEMNAVC